MMPEKFKEEFERIGGEDGLTACREFLELYVEYLKAEEPNAINSINLYQATIDELPGDYEDFIGSDEDDEE